MSTSLPCLMLALGPSFWGKTQAIEVEKPSYFRTDLPFSCCGEVLKFQGSLLQCPHCSKRWEQKDNLIRGSAHRNSVHYNSVLCDQDAATFYAEPLPRTVLNDFLRDARQWGWVRALYQAQRFSHDAGAKLFSSISEVKHNGWRFFLPLNPRANVLLLGAPTLGLASALAKHFNRLVVVDATLQRLQAMSAQAQTFGEGNIDFLHSQSPAELPYSVASFDILIIADAQDWVLQFLDSSPRTLPLDAFKNVAKYLKNDGLLYVAGDNRFTFTGLLQRSVDASVELVDVSSDEISDSGTRILRRGRKSSTSSQSYRGYQRCLQAAGMNSQHVFAPVPNHRAMREFVDLSRNSSFPSRHPQQSLSTLLKQRLRVNPNFLRAFGHSFAVLASPAASVPASFLDRVLPNLARELGVSHLEIEEFRVGEIESYALLRGAALRLQLRLPHDSTCAKLTIKNAQALRRLNTRQLPRVLSNVMPQWLYYATFEGQLLSVESWLEGVYLEEIVDYQHIPNLNEQIFTVLHALSAIRGSTGGRSGYGQVAPRSGAAIVRQMADVVAARLIDKGLRVAFLALVDKVASRIEQIALPSVWVHGAFDLRNLLWDMDRNVLSGLVNWHGSFQHGLPAWDLSAFEISLVKHRNACSMGEAVLYLLENKGLQVLPGLWSRYAESLSLNENSRNVLLLSYWAKCVWQEFLRELNPLNYAWLQKNVVNVLQGVKHF